MSNATFGSHKMLQKSCNVQASGCLKDRLDHGSEEEHDLNWVDGEFMPEQDQLHECQAYSPWCPGHISASFRYGSRKYWWLVKDLLEWSAPQKVKWKRKTGGRVKRITEDIAGKTSKGSKENSRTKKKKAGARHEGKEVRGELKEEKGRKERSQGKRVYSWTKHIIVVYYKNRTYVCNRMARSHLRIMCSTSFAEGTDSITLLAVSWSPAITALSDEEADGNVEEVEDEEYSMEQVSSQSQRKESSPASPTRLCSPSPAESALLISAMCQIEDPSQKNQTCENKSMLYSRGLLNMRGAAILQQAWCLIISLFQQKDLRTRWAGQCPHHHMDISSQDLSDFIYTSCQHLHHLRPQGQWCCMLQN